MTDNEMLRAIASKLENLTVQMDTLNEAITYQTKLVESIVESLPPVGKQKRDIMSAMGPILNNPLIMRSPELKNMMESFTKNLGGEGDE